MGVVISFYDVIIISSSIPSGDESSSDKRFSFRMIIWLVTYYEFYDKKVISYVM